MNKSNVSISVWARQLMLILTLLTVLFACASLNSPQNNPNILENSGCVQQYNFFLKAQFNDLFWIGESISGDCRSSKLIQILLEEGKEPQIISLMLKDYNRWQWIESAEDYLRRETSVELEKRGNTFVEKGSNLKVKPAPYNNSLLQFYQEKYNGVCAEEWNEIVKSQGIKEPEISGWKSELKYAHPKGLYFNYEISNVIFFPDTQYLLVFTQHSMRCVGDNTQHGFMLLKLTEK